MKRFWSLIMLMMTVFVGVAQPEVEPVTPAVDADSLSATSVSQTAPQLLTPQALLQQAADSYAQGDYDKAVWAYGILADAFPARPDVHYNLGCACFKQKAYARAILAFERCLLYDPRNEDAQVNLEMAQTQCVDKIDSLPEAFFVKWSNAVRDWLSCDGWGYLTIAAFLLFIVCLFLYFFMRRVALRKVGFYGALLALLFAAISFGYANAQRERLVHRDGAIVMQPTVTVRSSPAESGTRLFTIHEGLKVRVRSTLGEWSEVELSDGKVGWLPSESIEVI